MIIIINIVGNLYVEFRVYYYKIMILSNYELLCSLQTIFHQLSKKLSRLLSLKNFSCTVLLPLAQRPFLYITKQQLDDTVSIIKEFVVFYCYHGDR